MTGKHAHVLVIRFSAMGDVALALPVVKSFATAYPQHRLTFVSRPKFSVFFSGIANVIFFPADVDKTYSGFWGIVQLFFNLRKLKPDVVIDLHDHIRSRVLCFLFRVAGASIVRFDKGRREKKQITARSTKQIAFLPHTVNRYQQAFQLAGFDFPIIPPPYLVANTDNRKRLAEWLQKNNLTKNEMWIGLAPFAAHKSKIWRVQNYKAVIRQSIEKMKCRFFLFGGGANEIQFFNELKTEFPDHCVVVAGSLSLHEEIALISLLDKMLCVDSSNMHLAALMGIPTVSIWGGTHTATGFGAFGNQAHKIVEIETAELPCRPCSVYGKETCFRGDFACLNKITPAQVVANL